MSHYLLEIAYTPEAWAAQLEDPKNREEVIRPVLESVGARFECLYYAFGDRDIVGVIEAPDNVSVAAISLAFSAGGALKSCRTTPLMTVQEGMEAMRRGFRAYGVYKPPSEGAAAGTRGREKVRTN
ncbi:MAG: hypothetical protein JWO85_721 [Candidatus Eremiobacteraeota bacterium]|nr:hypothetical protein [Candidatus Eremiobacteraeota bacterium]